MPRSTDLAWGRLYASSNTDSSNTPRSQAFTFLTCDQIVTYCQSVTDEDLIFKALADSTRRLLLDTLHESSGQSLSELEKVVAGHVEMSRFGVAKHLKVLEAADLVIIRRKGREKLHYLNPVPIRLIHDRWIDKYSEERISALTHLKDLSERNHD